MFSPAGSPRAGSPRSEFATLRSRNNSFASTGGRSEPDRDSRGGLYNPSEMLHQFFPPAMMPIVPGSDASGASGNFFKMLPHAFGERTFSVSSTNSLTSDMTPPASTPPASTIEAGALSAKLAAIAAPKLDLSVVQNYIPRLKLDMSKMADTTNMMTTANERSHAVKRKMDMPSTDHTMPSDETSMEGARRGMKRRSIDGISPIQQLIGAYGNKPAVKSAEQ